MGRALFSVVLLLLFLQLFSASQVMAQDAFPYWVKTVRDAALWDGADAQAKTRVTISAGSFFAVTGPAIRGRFPVVELTSQRNGFLNESDIQRGAPPPEPAAQVNVVGSPQATATIPAPSAAGPGTAPSPFSGVTPVNPTSTGAFVPFWVANHSPASLWSGSEEKSLPLGIAEPGHWFKVLEAQRGPRLHVQDRLVGKELFIDAASVGPVGEPSGPAILGKWWGTVGADGINVRSAPDTRSRVIGQLSAGTPVVVDAWVEGTDVFGDQPGWAQLGNDAYIYGPLLRRVDLGAPPPPVEAPTTGKWIDVNITLQVMTAYEGAVPVYWTVTSGGRPGWETTIGVHRILWRKEVETMESNRLLSADAARADYRVENVRYTQYFTNDGQAIHENYWRAPELFGIPSSHGCLGLASDDARWFWDWARTGTPVIVHR
ncbi:MAG: L,D-transpeptidase family protein [Chloroflexota bacterium]